MAGGGREGGDVMEDLRGEVREDVEETVHEGELMANDPRDRHAVDEMRDSMAGASLLTPSVLVAIVHQRLGQVGEGLHLGHSVDVAHEGSAAFEEVVDGEEDGRGVTFMTTYDLDQCLDEEIRVERGHH